MAEKEYSSDSRIHKAISANRQSETRVDLTQLSDTLIKSPLWKHNTLRGIEDLQSSDNDNSAFPDTPVDPVDDESERLRKALAHRTKENKATRRELLEQSAVLEEHSGEIDRLRQIIARLEAEQALLAAAHQAELDATRAELADLQAAYEQFEQQSDILLSELDEQNERLRNECRLQNRFSVL